MALTANLVLLSDSELAPVTGGEENQCRSTFYDESGGVSFETTFECYQGFGTSVDASGNLVGWFGMTGGD